MTEILERMEIIFICAIAVMAVATIASVIHELVCGTND